MSMEDILNNDTRILPIITLNDLYHAVPLARALKIAGIKVIEINVCHTTGWEAIKLIKHHFNELKIGAGNIFEVSQIERAYRLGADFVTSPGFSPALCIASQKTSTPYLPSAATAAEIIQLKEFGFKLMGFFPVEELGGTRILELYQSVFADITFVPHGGIQRPRLRDYLALKNVIAVGANWFAPNKLLAEQNWEAITDIVKHTCSCILA